MHHPVLTNNLAQIKYNEMLQEADAARRARNLAGPTLRDRLGAYLVTVGYKLKSQQPTEAKASA